MVYQYLDATRMKFAQFFTYGFVKIYIIILISWDFDTSSSMCLEHRCSAIIAAVSVYSMWSVIYSYDFFYTNLKFYKKKVKRVVNR